MLKVLNENKGGIILLLAFVLMFLYYTNSIKVLTEMENNQQVVYYE